MQYRIGASVRIPRAASPKGFAVYGRFGLRPEDAALAKLRRGGRGGDAGALESENDSSRLARGMRKD